MGRPHNLTNLQLLDYIYSVGIRYNQCLLWPKAKMTGGYGSIYIRGRYYAVHRFVAWMGYKSFDLYDIKIDVCHTCDTPPCFEKQHLVVADRLYNVKDAITKGRIANRHLTMEQAREIRHLYATTINNMSTLATLYKVPRHSIEKIMLNEYYKDIE